MSKVVRSLRGLCGRSWGHQVGITGLSTAVVLIGFIIVANVFGFVILTTGIFVSDKSKAGVSSSLKQAAATLRLTGAVVGEETADGGKLGRVRFKVVLTGGAAGARIALPPSTTLLTYFDRNNQLVVPYTWSNAVNEPWWSHEWLLGTGQIVDPGDIVEFTVGFVSTGGDALSPMLGPATQFKSR